MSVEVEDYSFDSSLLTTPEGHFLLAPPDLPSLLEKTVTTFGAVIEEFKREEINSLMMFGEVRRILGTSLIANPALRVMIEEAIKEEEGRMLPTLAIFGVTRETIRDRYYLTRDWVINIPREFRGREDIDNYILGKVEALKAFLENLKAS